MYIENVQYKKYIYTKKMQNILKCKAANQNKGTALFQELLHSPTVIISQFQIRELQSKDMLYGVAVAFCKRIMN